MNCSSPETLKESSHRNGSEAALRNGKEENVWVSVHDRAYKALRARCAKERHGLDPITLMKEDCLKVLPRKQVPKNRRPTGYKARDRNTLLPSSSATPIAAEKPSGPRRLSLADLREAARRRRRAMEGAT